MPLKETYVRDIDDFFIKPTAAQKEFFEIHWGKHFIISRICLYLHLSLPDKPKDLAKLNFYNFFKKSIIGASEDFGYKRHIINNHNYILPAMRLEYEEIISKSIALMESTKYNPPKEIYNIINHLASLWFYFVNNFNYPHTLLYMKLNLSFIKVIGEANFYYASLIEQKMRDTIQQRESFRLNRARVEQSAKKEEKKTYTYELFYRSNMIKKGIKLHTAAKIIRNEFLIKQDSGVIPKDVKPPSVDTIKIYLKENDDILKIFNIK
jgi:hypothetical protein